LRSVPESVNISLLSFTIPYGRNGDFSLHHLIMKASFLAAINQICSEKNVNPEQVIEAVKQAIATAYRKDFGNKEQEIRVDLKEGQDMPTILLVKEVVDDVENDNFEISIKDAQKIKPDADAGDEIEIDVTPVEYGRIAAQAAKQVILQKLQEAEKQSLYEMFKDREEELLTANVTKVEHNWITLEIEGMTVSLPWKEQIPGEHYYTGKRIRVYLDKVEMTGKGPQLRISRTHPNLVENYWSWRFRKCATRTWRLKQSHVMRDSEAKLQYTVMTRALIQSEHVSVRKVYAYSLLWKSLTANAWI